MGGKPQMLRARGNKRSGGGLRGQRTPPEKLAAPLYGLDTEGLTRMRLQGLGGDALRRGLADPPSEQNEHQAAAQTKATNSRERAAGKIRFTRVGGRHSVPIGRLLESARPRGRYRRSLMEDDRFVLRTQTTVSPRRPDGTPKGTDERVVSQSGKARDGDTRRS